MFYVSYSIYPIVCFVYFYGFDVKKAPKPRFLGMKMNNFPVIFVRGGQPNPSPLI